MGHRRACARTAAPIVTNTTIVAAPAGTIFAVATSIEERWQRQRAAIAQWRRCFVFVGRHVTFAIFAVIDQRGQRLVRRQRAIGGFTAIDERWQRVVVFRRAVAAVARAIVTRSC